MEISFNEYQKLLKENFEKINSFFNEHKIFWWANSGTLLGAIRDKDLIAWDDDIDMSMFNIDFIQKKEQIKLFLEKIGWELCDATKKYGLDVVRMFSKEKILVSYKGKTYVQKLHIDIMIAVPSKGSSKLKSHIHSTICNYSWIYGDFYRVLPYYGLINGEVKRINFFINLFIFIIKILTFPFLFWAPLYQNYKLKKINQKSNYYQYFYCWNNKGLGFEYKNKNKNFKKVPFGNTEILIYKNFESELEEYYGPKWNLLPDKEKRIPHNMVLTPNDREYKISPFLIK